MTDGGSGAREGSGASGDAELAAFLRVFARLGERAATAVGGPASEEVVAVVRAHVGAGAEWSVVGRELPPYEHVNLQVALDAWSGEDGRRVDVRGVTIPPHYGPVTLQHLLHGEGLPPVRLSAPDLVDLPSGPRATLACLRSALLLVEDARGRYALFVRGPDRHGEPVLNVEVAGLATADAQAVLGELDRLRAERNVYRGHLLELGLSPDGAPVITFATLPPTARDDVVLPEAVLARVERHTLDIAARREGLRAAGQHLKRGLLLYGPPGTGKTHTTRYLVQHLPGYTVLMLSGQSLHIVGTVTRLARDLQPAAVVCEDVDLVAEDRGFGPGSSPVLFELLDAMDGAAADADLVFLLTTNRADLLEPALAARPGRVDVAVEIGLPDEDGRRRLLELYGRGVADGLTEAAVAEVVRRTEGTTASFVKELLRRAVLEALDDTPWAAPGGGGRAGAPPAVTEAHLTRALDDLLDSTQGVTRALLGVPADQSGPVQLPPAGRAAGGHGGLGWTEGLMGGEVYGEPGAMPAAYRSELRFDAED